MSDNETEALRVELRELKDEKENTLTMIRQMMERYHSKEAKIVELTDENQQKTAELMKMKSVIEQRDSMLETYFEENDSLSKQLKVRNDEIKALIARNECQAKSLQLQIEEKANILTENERKPNERINELLKDIDELEKVREIWATSL
ncbi:hypothetical protein AB6A40_007979 [Gnathostoma spinigerum]|uniref:Uncharacterized protein n=1 Tax=Gnathostoma spinigerum TaxID=75299 RepID=A0ABD6EYE0_9BILA